MARVEPNTEQEHNEPAQFVTQNIILFLDIQMSRKQVYMQLVKWLQLSQLLLVS